MKLVTVDEMKAIEREANQAGLSYEQMMEKAGTNLAQVVKTAYGHIKDEGVLGLVGSGNNGGDTLVALSFLANQGWMTSAYIVRPRPENDPLLARLSEAGGEIYLREEDGDFQRLTDLLRNHGIVLDGVLGTGIRLPLKGDVADVLDFARRKLSGLKDSHVVAVDCPSGVDCDSGETASQAIPAELTVTMAAAKVGLLNFPAFKLVGELKLVGIGLTDDDLHTNINPEAWRGVKRIMPSHERVRRMLPERPADAHKGTFGTALIVAGSVNFTGAALLSSEAAYRSGAGLVTVAVARPLHTILAGHLPEATWLLLPHEDGFIAEEAAGVLLENLSKPTSMLIGPGFGMADTTRRFLERLFARDGQASDLPPLVIDADGLKLLSQISEWPKRLPSPAVLTPHPGEMGVLTGLSIKEIQSDRLAIAERYAKQWGHVVVLKGAFTIIAAPDGHTAIIPIATPALARAGTGDVLAGLITGLRAQGMEAFQAAVAGAWIHGKAGLWAADAIGNTASVLAGDVLQSSIDVISDLQ